MCGVQSDGCGGVTANCGTCTAPAVCGGAGPSHCGTAACTPKTCAMMGFMCGMASDGCGGLINCGTCAAPSTCSANKCL
jgi:hypothetical protein